MELASQNQQLTSKPARTHPLDQLLNKRIGNGPAQTRLSMSLYILMFTQGCQSVVISLLLPQLQKQWSISTDQKSLLITMIYVGVAIGSFIQSYADQYGRLTFLKWNAILQTIFGLLSCISPSMNIFILCRFAYGIGIGIILPLSGTYISEITPSADRALLVGRSRVCWSIGCLLTFISAWYLLQTHQWRLLLLLICAPGIYALYDICKTGRQSLRYLWVTGRTEQSYQMIKQMCILNQKQLVKKQQIEYLISLGDEKTVQVEYKQLFNSKYLKMTIYMSVAWFTACFIYYGIFLLLPSILARNNATSYNQKYLAMIVINMFEILSFFLIKPIIDNPLLGRKRSLYLAFFMIMSLCLLLIVVGESTSTAVLLVSFLIMRMAAAITAVAIIPYTIQIYSTLIRSKGIGFCAVIGRIGSVTLGIVGLSSLQWFGGNGLYVIFASLALISGTLVYKMPYCTLGRSLDS